MAPTSQTTAVNVRGCTNTSTTPIEKDPSFMKIAFKVPNEVYPHDPLAVADHLEATAMQTDDPDETAG
jgi:hypothetical protein